MMEVKLLQKEKTFWILSERIRKRIQVSAELVIPDTMEDVKSIVWTRGCLLLKGKEPEIHAFSAAGEALANILLLTDKDELELLNLRKSFESSFEVREIDTDALPQLSWYIQSIQSRLLNPRKLSVSFEICADLRCFQRKSSIVETALPEDVSYGLHILQNQTETLQLDNIKEKPFTLREQLPISSEDGFPHDPELEEIVFRLHGTEQIGSRCIVKGECGVTFCGLADNGLPSDLRFRIPFSQLVDIGEEKMDSCTVRIEPNSVYAEWSREAASTPEVDLEIHAVIQMSVYSRQTILSVSDAYSTQMPLTAETAKYAVISSLERSRSSVQAEERLEAPEDMQDLLSVQGKLGLLEQNENEMLLPVVLEMLYRKEDGSYGAARRMIRCRTENLPKEALLMDQRLNTLEASTEKDCVMLSVDAEMQWDQETEKELTTITSLHLQEDHAWARSSLPDLSIVRRGGESLWELAKEYHTSAERIASANEPDAEMLLIPAE